MEDMLRRARDDVLAKFDNAAKVIRALAEPSPSMVHPTGYYRQQFDRTPTPQTCDDVSGRREAGNPIV